MRAFLALNPPAEEQARIHGAAARLREAGLPVRWVERDAIHLTLKFLGEVPEPRIPDLRRAAEAGIAGFAPFDVALGAVGAFPTLPNARVVWLGVEAAPVLMELQAALERELEHAGFPRESRAFHPHLTLGRAQRDTRAGALHGLAALARELDYRGVLPARSVDLMRSTLTPQGARYDRLAAFRLSGGGEGRAGDRA